MRTGVRALVLATAVWTGLSGWACSHDANAPAGPPDSTAAQWLTVRRAWRPGERDSLAAYVVRTGAWGEYSDLAPQAVLGWDSTSDIVVNPAWVPAPAATGVQLAPAFAAGWGSVGLDIRTVFDSIPGGPLTKDSLDWVMTFWWNPADSTWKGYVVRATTAGTFAYQTLNTTAFNSSNGKSGQGGGEVRLATSTYWEANGGQYRITSNGGYGARTTIASGPYTGGNVQFGTMAGRLNAVTMPRLLGTDTPATKTVNFNFGLAPINSQRIFCYFPPVTPPTGYTQCTGAAFARIVAAAQARNLSASRAAGMSDPVLAAPAPSRRRRPSSRCRRIRRMRSVLV